MIYIDNKRIKRFPITKPLEPNALVTFKISSPFSQTLLDTIHFLPSNNALIVCIFVTNALIIAHKAHILKNL